jgi:hypothetical protein
MSGRSPVIPSFPPLSSPPGLRSLRLACWGAALLLGALDACSRPFAMQAFGSCPDGVSYLDLAAAYGRGDWAHGLNAYWSPLYSWLLALAFRLLRPSAAAEFPVAHLVNLIIYAAALGGFEYLFRGWMQDHQARTDASGRSGWLSLPPWALLVIGYTLFTWSAIRLIGGVLMTPDLLVAAVVYLAAGLTLRLRREAPPPALAALLGLVLGLGFLAKAVMLPLTLVFLLVAFLPVRDARRTALSLLAAGFAFGIVTGPFLSALGRKEGRFSPAETGRLNYAWYVNGVPRFHWQGETPGHGKAQHPTRLVFPAPPVYAFAGPAGETYPIWTDPSYWNAGLRPRFNGREQARAVLGNLERYPRKLFLKEQSSLAAGMLLFLLMPALVMRRRYPSRVRWDLLLIFMAPLILYTLVDIQSRYLGAYIVLFWLALLPEIRLPANRRSRAMAAAVTLLILLTPALGLARVSARDLLHRRVGDADWETATGLAAMGIRAGDPVGCVGLSLDNAWARLARVSVIAEIPTDREAEYWGASPTVRAAVLRAFSRTGARAVVTARPPAGADAAGWQRLGATDRYIRLLHPPARRS